MERVREQSTTDFILLAGGTTVAAAARKAARTRHVVITTDQGLPIGLVEARQLSRYTADMRLMELARTLPATALVPGELSVGTAVRAAVIDQLPSSAPGAICVSRGLPVGIWKREDIDVAAFAFGGATRGPAGGGGGAPSDSILPGDIEIPKLSHECWFTEDGERCADYRTFPEPPDEMPACRNPRKLTPHTFVW
jgi:hypothetical protein